MFLKILFFLLFTTIAFAQIPPMGIQDESGPVTRPVYILRCTGLGVNCSQSGTTGIINVTGGAASTNKMLLVDNSSYFLLVDSTSKLLLAQ